MVRELQDEFQKFKETAVNGEKAVIWIGSLETTYPFRQSTLHKLDENIGNIKFHLSWIRNKLQLDHTWRYGDDVSEVKALLELVKPSHIRVWYSAPDATHEHIAACGKKYPGTGMWLIKSSQFSNWLTNENSVIWLKGSAGSGKSILCSTAIHAALRHRGYNRGIGIAFFYFTFN